MSRNLTILKLEFYIGAVSGQAFRPNSSPQILNIKIIFGNFKKIDQLFGRQKLNQFQHRQQQCHNYSKTHYLFIHVDTCLCVLRSSSIDFTSLWNHASKYWFRVEFSKISAAVFIAYGFMNNSNGCTFPELDTIWYLYNTIFLHLPHTSRAHALWNLQYKWNAK